MRVSVFGLGYVGAASAGCLADDGHEVTGVDPVPTKVDLINRLQMRRVRLWERGFQYRFFTPENPS